MSEQHENGRVLIEPKLTSEIDAPPGTAERQAAHYARLTGAKPLRIPPEHAVLENRPRWWRRLLNRTRARRS